MTEGKNFKCVHYEAQGGENRDNTDWCKTAKEVLLNLQTFMSRNFFFLAENFNFCKLNFGTTCHPRYCDTAGIHANFHGVWTAIIVETVRLFVHSLGFLDLLKF